MPVVQGAPVPGDPSVEQKMQIEGSNGVPNGLASLASCYADSSSDSSDADIEDELEPEDQITDEETEDEGIADSNHLEKAKSAAETVDEDEGVEILGVGIGLNNTALVAFKGYL